MPAKGQTKPRPVTFCDCGNHAFANLTKGLVVLVDVADAHFLQERPWCANVNNTGAVYAYGSVDGKLKLLHVEIMSPSTGEQIDHKNHNGCDDRRHNLRPCSDLLNKFNTRRRSPTKTSKYKGVSWNAATQKWRSRIKVGKAHLSLGCYDIEEHAAKAYDAAALQHYGEFACVNFTGV